MQSDDISGTEIVRGLVEAVFGFDDDGILTFYFPEEGAAARRSGDYMGQRYADCDDLPDEVRPVLALVKSRGGFWIGKPCEWVELEAEPNGWLAYTSEQAQLLMLWAEVDDKLVLLGEGTTFPQLLQWPT